MSDDHRAKHMIHEIRWHGRGGQGAVTAAHALAEAAFFEGYAGVTSVPAFGAERRGMPVSASTRFAPQIIRTYSQIEMPDVVVVLDERLLEDPSITEGLKPKGWLIVNSTQEPHRLQVNGDFNLATVDAARVSGELGLLSGGLPLVNTAILGAFSRATGLVGMGSIEEALRRRFNGSASDANVNAAKITHQRTILSPRSNGDTGNPGPNEYLRVPGYCR